MSGNDKVFIPEWGPPQETKPEMTFTDEGAFRLARRSDAVRFIEAERDRLGLHDVLITEHQWS